MKFAILVLLGLCAIAAHAQYMPEYDVESWEPRNQITDKIRAKISELVKKATEEFGVISDKVSAIVSKLREDARDLIMKGKAKVDEARAAIQNKMDELKKKGGAFAKCAKELEPEYKKVESETMSELKKCAGEVMVAKEEHKEASAKAVAEIRANLGSIRDMVADCLGWNPIKTGKCIFDKTDELKKLVDGVVSGCRDALRVSRQRAHDILAKAKECNGRVLSNAAAQVKDLNERLSKCYQNSEFEFY